MHRNGARRTWLRWPGRRRADGGMDVASLIREIAALTDEVRALARAARTDPLTGLANRRGWDEQFGRELARVQRSGGGLSIALLDLDDFKSFNDTHGHQAGDRLLVEAAAAWRGQLRDMDLLCRWGGDEFVVLLPDCSRREAQEVIARLRPATPRPHACTAAVAAWDGRETSHDLFRRADTALLEQKRIRRGTDSLAPVHAEGRRSAR